MATQSNTYNSTSAAPLAMPSNGIPKAPNLNSYTPQQGGTNNPYNAPLTYANQSARPYMDVGGLTFGVATPDQYTSYQLNNLLKADNPYMQNARQSGIDLANSRGLLNSGLAGQNAQAAAIQAAMPIAKSDADMLANLQTTNLKDKTSEDVANIGAAAQTGAAGISAAASMSNNAASLQEAMQAQRERLAYEGEQAGLGRDWASQFAAQNQDYNLTNMMQQYYNSSGLLGQQQSNNMANNMFNLGANLLQGGQQFSYNAGLKAMDNPAIMGDPQAFGGYMQWLQGPFNSILDGIFGSLFGGSFGG